MFPNAKYDETGYVNGVAGIAVTSFKAYFVFQNVRS